MGVTLQKDKKNKYYVVVRHAGKRESRCVGLVDKRTAMVRVRQVRKELAVGLYQWKDNGEAVVTKHPVFEYFAKDFLEMNKSRLKHSTWTSYRNLIQKYLLPEWDNFILTEIDKQDVKKLLLKAQADGLNTNNLRICCSSIFQWGCDNDVLQTNPARGLGRAFRNGTMVKQDMQVLSSEQVAAFLEKVPKDWRCFCLLLFRTGLRLGEAMGLAWKDIDFRTKKITVQRAFVHNEWTTPKSNKRRYVDMTPKLVETLQNRQRTIESKSIRIGTETISLIFANKKGQPISDKVLRRDVWKPTLKKCKLPESFRIHDARHTFASLLLMKGLPVLYVQQQLGHASATTTLNKYGHYIPAENSHDTSVLDE